MEMNGNLLRSSMLHFCGNAVTNLLTKLAGFGACPALHSARKYAFVTLAQNFIYKQGRKLGATSVLSWQSSSNNTKQQKIGAC